MSGRDAPSVHPDFVFDLDLVQVGSKAGTRTETKTKTKSGAQSPPEVIQERP